jgi:hypothetical protein
MSSSRRSQKRSLVYDLKQSPFYGLKSKRDLAALLRIDLSQLRSLLRGQESDLYAEINIKKKGELVLRKDGSPRLAEVPLPSLRRIHKRLLALLSRIFVPSYVHCSIKHRSYITNARAHIGTGPGIVLDLRRYYPSTKLRHIAGCFVRVFRCSPDVAFAIAKLCTYRGHLPTGSCISGRLSYYAHKETFDLLSAEALRRGLTMTLYMDDLTISGDRGVRDFAQLAKTEVRRIGLDYREEGCFKRGQPKTITGVIVTDDNLALPNRRHQAIIDCLLRWQTSTDPDERSQLGAQLLGRLGEADQIDPLIRRRITNRFYGPSTAAALRHQ